MTYLLDLYTHRDANILTFSGIADNTARLSYTAGTTSTKPRSSRHSAVTMRPSAVPSLRQYLHQSTSLFSLVSRTHVIVNENSFDGWLTDHDRLPCHSLGRSNLDSCSFGSYLRVFFVCCTQHTYFIRILLLKPQTSAKNSDVFERETSASNELAVLYGNGAKPAREPFAWEPLGPSRQLDRSSRNQM